jgi:hypothetical protein
MRSTLSRVFGVLVAVSLAGMALMFMAISVDEIGNGELTAAVAVMLVAGVGIFGSLALGPVGRAVGRMIEGDGSRDETLHDAIRDLDDRVHELSMDSPRVRELEERLEFAERLLARQSEGAQP